VYEEFLEKKDEEADKAIRRATKTGRPFWNRAIYRSLGISVE
jgi:hypothetical protein